MTRRLTMLLDLDGTIADSEAGIRASCLAALRALGHQPDELHVGAFIGPPLEQVLEAILKPLGDDRVADAVIAYREHYGSTGLLLTTAYPGIAQAISELEAMDVQLLVATSKRRTFAERIVERLNLSGHFAGIYGSEPGGAVDRKADLIGHILQARGIHPDDCLMVGDRREDMLGALANRVPAVGVLWGYGDLEELQAAGASRIVSEPMELVFVARDMQTA